MIMRCESRVLGVAMPSVSDYLSFSLRHVDTDSESVVCLFRPQSQWK